MAQVFSAQAREVIPSWDPDPLSRGKLGDWIILGTYPTRELAEHACSVMSHRGETRVIAYEGDDDDEVSS